MGGNHDYWRCHAAGTLLLLRRWYLSVGCAAYQQASASAERLICCFRHSHTTGSVEQPPVHQTGSDSHLSVWGGQAVVTELAKIAPFPIDL